MNSDESPIRLILIFALATLLPGLALDNWQAYQQTALPHVASQHWGNDYRFFFGAARSVWNGESPYADWFFTSPPLAAFLSLPLVGLFFEKAFPIFTVVSVLSLIGGLWLLCKSLISKHHFASFLILLVALLAGLPCQFLISRGNIDGIIFILTITAVCLIYRFPSWSGVFLGLAASLKLYPLLLLLPLVVLKCKRASLVMIGTILFCGFFTLIHWSAFAKRLLFRTSELRVDENVSLTAAFHFPITTFNLHGSLSSQWIAFLFFGVVLGWQLWTDWHQGKSRSGDELTARLCLYFPLMVSMPALVFNYELIFVVATIPAIAWIRALNTEIPTRRALPWMIAGAGLTQFHSILASNMTGLAMMHFIPALGLWLLITAIAACKWKRGNGLTVDT